MTKPINIEIKAEDALVVQADVLALKYAQGLYGLDRSVTESLSIKASRLPHPSEFILLDSKGRLGAKQVLFIGVLPLRLFRYREIREFARRVLSTLATESPDVQHVCLTIHGTGYGLDETEAFESEIAGLLDAVTSGDIPQNLSTITVVERKTERAKRLQLALKRLIPLNSISRDREKTDCALGQDQSERLRAVGYASASKPHVFVAMPFSDDMDDAFHYGIQAAVNSAGFLCERADTSSFAGDVMDWVKNRISNATFVIADLTTANPNVYLEVGFAWGCGKQTILLIRDTSELKFDVKGQRCLVYKKIKDLEQSLGKELRGLSSKE